MVVIATLFCIISVSALKFLIPRLTETVLSLCRIAKSDANKVREATRKLCLVCMSLLADIFLLSVAQILNIWFHYFCSCSSTSQMTFLMSVQTIILISLQNGEIYMINTF